MKEGDLRRKGPPDVEAVDAQTLDAWVCDGASGISDMAALSVSAFAGDLAAACDRLLRKKAKRRQWAPQTTRLAGKLAARSREGDHGEREV